ncbi:mechanosensitive ion channel family protein [Metallumcola ferriviriculae]|uniref:Mechanosensitive ion channel family protein n=1 Tax=Metallumcola ferriviriculae TaxID=3039180 RepID=A0AAU0UH97_9FIRM|nr:mechanosensitive ion channel family protein [Desulfitibacteraceae bacterium MK1]
MDFNYFFSFLESYVVRYITYGNLFALIKVVLLFVAARLVIFVGNKIIEKIFAKAETGRLAMDEKLAHTVKVLAKTFLIYGVYFAAALITLEIFQIPIIDVVFLKTLGSRAFKAILIFIAARLVLRFGGLAIDHIFNREDKEGLFLEERRAHTLSVLLRSILMYTVYFIAGLMVLEIFTIPTGSILASAGIAGLAVGFGAQNLVKDIITGFFIIFEDQFSVGEFVSVAEVTGIVDEMGLRTTKVREWTGQLHTIPNGEIGKVTNYNRGKMAALVSIGIAYEADVDWAIEVLRKTSEQAYQDMATIVDVPVVQGVVELADSAVVIRTVAQTVPGEQWAVERELRKLFKQALDANGIEIPYPRRVVITPEETDKPRVGEGG